MLNRGLSLKHMHAQLLATQSKVSEVRGTKSARKFSRNAITCIPNGRMQKHRRRLAELEGGRGGGYPKCRAKVSDWKCIECARENGAA